jgi:hypothetical protein
MFLGNNDSTEILKNIFKDRKDYGYRIFEYQNPEISVAEVVSFWKKTGFIRFSSPQKMHMMKILKLKFSGWQKKTKYMYH